jgi:hypothetical protein
MKHAMTFVLLALLLGISGCGRGRPTTHPVSGIVTLDGKPLQGAGVMLMPEAGGRPAVGTTNQRGEFTLTTFDPNDGALPGKHAVTVVLKKTTSGVMTGPDGLSGPIAPGGIKEQWIVPKKYADPKTSGLSAEVRPGMEPLKLDLRSR